MSLKDVYIVSACRTGTGSFNGQFKNIPASALGATVIKHCLQRSNISAKDISEVIMGQVLTAGQGQNPARKASMDAGIPKEVPAFTINMLCGSGVKTVQLGYNSIRSGDAQIVVCGGQENMSLAHHSAFIRVGMRMGNREFQDTLIADGLTDVFTNKIMGETVEYLARKYNISRDEQDKFALQSQQRAVLAIKEGYFRDEIVPVQQNNPFLEITKDEFVKPDATYETLSKLTPAFETDPAKNPTVTAGNASGLNDGAAAVILANEDQMKLRSLKPLAKIVNFATTGLEPIEMGIGPISAIQELLGKIGWTTDEVDLYEINEAYAAQSIIIIKELGLDPEKVNVAGGGIALGHPLAASGTRILVTLIYNLKRLKLKKGIASLCIGGGMGIAIAVEIVD